MKKLLIFFILFFAIALEADIGKIVNIKGDVLIVREGKTITAKSGDELLIKDIVKTGDSSRTRIIFSDNTSISLGKNTEFRIDNYKFEPKNKKLNRAAFKVNQGIFRTITGKMSKLTPEKFQLKTKTWHTSILRTSKWKMGSGKLPPPSRVPFIGPSKN